MDREANEVLGAALRLPQEQRAEVIAKLLRSLDPEQDDDVEAAWVAEIEHRARRVQNGEGQFEDWELIRDQLRPSS